LGKEYFYTNQFANERCIDAHYFDTGPELSIQLHRAGIYEDQPLTFVSGAGTGATFTGVGRRLREEFRDLELVLVEPSGCSMRHDYHAEHAMEGIAVGVAPPFVREAEVDRFMECTHPGMDAMQNRIARTWGRFIGNSSAAVLDAAVRYKRENPDRQVVTVVYDEGGWYI
jgi:cysteine synthase